MTKIKEKIGLYKTLITLFWTAFIISIGGSYKVFHTGEKFLLYCCLISITFLVAGTIYLMKRTKFWINKLED